MIEFEDFIDSMNSVSAPMWNILIIAIGIVVGLVTKMVVHLIFNLYRKKADNHILSSISLRLHSPASLLLPAIALNIAEIWMRMPPVWLTKVIELLTLAAFAFLLIRLVKVVEDVIKSRNDILKSDNLKERKIRTQIEFIAKITIGLIVVVTISAMLLSFDNLRKIGTGLLAGVGVGSIIIGFAAQSTLSNILAGFQIAFTQPIRIEDVVVVEGEWGKVEDITLTYVVVRIWDERRLILPINYFIQKPFQNWTRASSDLLGTVFLYLDYTVPLDKLRARFHEVLNGTSLWDRRAAVMHVTDSRENTLEVRALMSARNSGDAFELRCLMREELISFIRENYPQALPKQRTEFLNSEIPSSPFN